MLIMSYVRMILSLPVVLVFMSAQSAISNDIFTPPTVARIESYENHARWWQYGWISAYAGNAAVSAYEIGRTHNAAARRLHAVNAIASIGSVREMLVHPIYPPAFSYGHGTGRTELHRLQELAEDVRDLGGWKSRLEGWLTGLIGGIVVAAGPGRTSDGINFFVATGVATELQIWTLPREALVAWQKYQQVHEKEALVDELSLLKTRPSTPMLAGIGVSNHSLQLCWQFF